MSLVTLLTEFSFDLETIDLMSSLGRTSEQLVNEMSQLSFNNNLVDFTQNDRRRLNSVLLRLQIYAEQKLDETTVRTHLKSLNNDNVNNLLNYIYSLYSTDTLELEVNDSDPIADMDEPSESTRFDTFFQECVEQTTESTDIVKSSEFYSSFSNWWNNLYDNEIPDKKDLKSYLNDKLGKSTKNTWNKVCLTV
jgi:hypothetical protein